MTRLLEDDHDRVPAVTLGHSDPLRVETPEVPPRRSAPADRILNKLRRAGFIRSVKGPGGGYLLAREPKGISIAAILNELEGPVAITSCPDPEEGCARIEGCVTHLLWKSLGAKIRAFLETITLQDLIEKEPLLKNVKKNALSYKCDPVWL